MDRNRLQLAIAIIASSIPLAFTVSCKKSPGAVSAPASTTQGRPGMHVVSVSARTDSARPLEIKFDLFNNGQTTTAVSQSQFSAALMTDERPWLFTGPLNFPPGTPEVFTLKPGNRITLMATALNDRISGKSWAELAPRTSTFRIYINSGKTEDFPDQWLGQTYSDDSTFVRDSSR